jgi:outer membrane scaffolding protein for murein synthesis (MipA/OmpV family)
MKTALNILLATLFCTVAISAAAQRHSVSLGWGASIPTGGENFRNKTSVISPSVAWEYRLTPHLSAGLSTGYGYAGETGVTRDMQNGDRVDGYSERRLTLVPVQARLRLFPLGSRETMFRPFVTLSGGGQYARFRITGEAIYSSNATNFEGLLSAGGGVRCHPRADKGLFVELSGDWQWAGNAFEVMNTRSQRSVEIRLGVGFTM